MCMPDRARGILSVHVHQLNQLTRYLRSSSFSHSVLKLTSFVNSATLPLVRKKQQQSNIEISCARSHSCSRGFLPTVSACAWTFHVFRSWIFRSSSVEAVRANHDSPSRFFNLAKAFGYQLPRSLTGGERQHVPV